MSIAQALLPEFDQEMANTRKLLELVPEDKFDYKPHEKSMPLGRLAGHTAEMAGWATTTMSTEGLELTSGNTKPFAPASRKELLDSFDKGVGGVIRSMVISHVIHHRAQLGVYLRLNEVEFPGMYGPSADEMKQFQTAQA
jgi:uncharacterized damage-inducible protein DinB